MLLAGEYHLTTAGVRTEKFRKNFRRTIRREMKEPEVTGNTSDETDATESEEKISSDEEELVTDPLPPVSKEKEEAPESKPLSIKEEARQAAILARTAKARMESEHTKELQRTGSLPSQLGKGYVPRANDDELSQIVEHGPAGSKTRTVYTPGFSAARGRLSPTSEEIFAQQMHDYENSARTQYEADYFQKMEAAATAEATAGIAAAAEALATEVKRRVANPTYPPHQTKKVDFSPPEEEEEERPPPKRKGTTMRLHPAAKEKARAAEPAAAHHSISLEDESDSAEESDEWQEDDEETAMDTVTDEDDDAVPSTARALTQAQLDLVAQYNANPSTKAMAAKLKQEYESENVLAWTEARDKEKLENIELQRKRKAEKAVLIKEDKKRQKKTSGADCAGPRRRSLLTTPSHAAAQPSAQDLLNLSPETAEMIISQYRREQRRTSGTSRSTSKEGTRKSNIKLGRTIMMEDNDTSLDTPLPAPQEEEDPMSRTIEYGSAPASWEEWIEDSSKPVTQQGIVVSRIRMAGSHNLLGKLPIFREDGKVEDFLEKVTNTLMIGNAPKDMWFTYFTLCFQDNPTAEACIKQAAKLVADDPVAQYSAAHVALRKAYGVTAAQQAHAEQQLRDLRMRGNEDAAAYFERFHKAVTEVSRGTVVHFSQENLNVFTNSVRSGLREICNKYRYVAPNDPVPAGTSYVYLHTWRELKDEFVLADRSMDPYLRNNGIVQTMVQQIAEERGSMSASGAAASLQMFKPHVTANGVGDAFTAPDYTDEEKWQLAAMLKEKNHTHVDAVRLAGIEGLAFQRFAQVKQEPHNRVPEWVPRKERMERIRPHPYQDPRNTAKYSSSAAAAESQLWKGKTSDKCTPSESYQLCSQYNVPSSADFRS